MAQQQYGSQQWAGGGQPRPRPGGKGLPIAIGAGLAVGVFAGLIVVRGTGAEASSTGPSDDVDAGAATATVTPDAAAVATTTPDAAPVATVTIDAAPAKPPAPVLTFAVEPADLEDLEISVDGAVLEGTTFSVELPEGKTERRVKVRAKARGYRSFSRRLTVSANETVAIKLKKRGRGTTGGHTTSPGGLIDL